MKNSKWMRFLLIALSAVMVLSLFACGDNGSTTEETTVDNTEDTTVEDTTVEDTTVEDTTVEDTTVEDTTVEDTTVEDTTVEDTTAPVEINVELTPDKLAGLDNMTNIAGITLSADGSYVTVKPTADTNDNYFYAYYFNTAVTGRYAVIKYRTSANVNSFNIYASTSRDGATDGDDLVTAYIVADGEWHVMLVDLDAVKTVEADENGDYTVKFLRIDPFRGIGNATGAEEVDIAYVGVHESVYNLDLVANSSSMLELGNQFTFSIDSADLGGTAFSGGVNGTTVKAEITVSRDNANIAITGGWIAVNGQAFTNMGVYYKIVDANGNATRLTKAGMNIMAAEEGVINHCATANPGATPMRVDGSKGGLVFPDLKAYSGQTVTIYVYAISDSMWEEQGVIAGRTVLVLNVKVEKSEKAQIGDVVYEDMDEAFAAAKDGDTVKILKDVTLAEIVEISKEITINLNGKTVTGSFNVGEGGALTIGGGTLAGEITTEDGGVAVVKDGTFVGFDPSDILADGYAAVASGANYVVYRALTIPEALEIAGKLDNRASTSEKYYTKGVITSIYSTQYGNCWIKDEDGNTMIVYGLYSADGSIRYDSMSVKPQVGDTIEIIGVLKKYESDLEYSNAWVVGHEAHTCDWSDATCSDPKTCKICGTTEGSTVDHVYEDGACKWCEVAEGVTTVTASKTMKELITANGWTSSTTKQSFKLDDVVSVKINGGQNTGKAYDGDHIRLYATDSPAATVTISVPEGYELVSIKISTVTGTYAFLQLNGVDICNTTTNVSGSSVVLNSVKNGSNGKQVRVTGIEVVYQLVG